MESFGEVTDSQMCTPGSSLWLRLMGGGETERRSPRTERLGRSAVTVGEGAGTGDTPLEDLTGMYVPVLQAGFTQGERKWSGDRMRSEASVLHACLSCWHRPQCQTEPQAGVRTLQDWQRSPALPSGMVRKLGHPTDLASGRSCLPFLFDMVSHALLDPCDPPIIVSNNKGGTPLFSASQFLSSSVPCFSYIRKHRWSLVHSFIHSFIKHFPN